MKKIIIATMCLFTLIIGLTACSSKGPTDSSNVSEVQISIGSALQSKVIPLLCKESSDNVAKTNNEDIYFSCNEKYTLFPGSNGEFLFSLSKWSEDTLKYDFDWTIDISCNKEIIRADYYRFEDVLIASEDLKTKVISVDQYVKSSYCSKIVLSVQDNNGQIYSADFVRSGL